MGQQFCSPGDDVVLRLVTSNEIEGLAKLSFRSSSCSPQHADLPVANIDNVGSFGPMSSMYEKFELEAPLPQDLPSTRLVRGNRGEVRRLHLCRKPTGKDCQERLRMQVARLQAQTCEGIARILEVFEDSRAIAMVMEHCSGGTLQDRILQRHFFAEQESAMLVRHMLQAVQALHRAGLYHGHLSPDSFRFHTDQAQAPLKLVDFGLELKACLLEWSPESGHEQLACQGQAARHWPRSSCPQLFEACRTVFCAPEVFKQLKAGAAAERQPDLAPLLKGVKTGKVSNMLDLQLLSEAIDTHLERSQDLGIDFPSDVWSVGAIAFLLLCGYPPFFSPIRQAIIARVEKIDFSFDPPFWSKISEEAKDFVQKCMHGVPGQRLKVEEALQHPWILRLADTSPSGPMLPSFALNLRRFYRTSIIEATVGNGLASKLMYRATIELQQECHRADRANTGFLTSADLRQVLQGSGHSDIADVISSCFARYLKHAGESYLDYAALFDSVRLRREILLEEELWGIFAEGGANDSEVDVRTFLQATALGKLLQREGAQDLCIQGLSGLELKSEADFQEITSAVFQILRSSVIASMATAPSKE
ncbi:unnamed protein product [Effrenium voratum]|uniref:Protein kinase domain-containing protein n=1 Tax=Effrenium voratum TaxID=2562239 RepID=A0AA36HPY8_9DINO|nr:unnamed protein product [Effrenium voratum]CAJ1373175.1 unnamed protein product [Effrenium voratum]CAJ1450383.1 unnamed protein product [Effrenium voratum]